MAKLPAEKLSLSDMQSPRIGNTLVCHVFQLKITVAKKTRLISSDRSDRIIEKINEAINDHSLQVIVFTHRPMEFAGFTGRMVDIQSVK